LVHFIILFKEFAELDNIHSSFRTLFPRQLTLPDLRNFPPSGTVRLAGLMVVASLT
jgi:hypothetical protein